MNIKVQRARQALAKEIYRRNATVVYAVNPPGLTGTKVGPDDFLLAHGLDAFLDLDAFELPPTDLPLFSEPVSSLLSGPDEPLEWGIIGLQPTRANGWRIAAPKTGKSWDMLEEAYCLCTQQTVFGHFAVPQKRRVLVIEEEDPKRRIARRLKRIICAHGGVQPSDQFFRYSVKKGVRLDDPKWREVIDWEIRQFLPEFVYLDVFSRLHGQDMNDARAMGEIVLFLDRLNREYGCAFIILHHTRKNGADGDDHDEILGSRVLGGFAEASLFFSRTKEKGILLVRVALKDEPEDGSFEPEFLIQLTDTPDQQGTHFTYLGVPVEKRAALDLREKIKAFVLRQESPVSVKDAAAAAGCSKPAAREHLTILVDLKVLIRSKQGQRVFYAAPEKATGNTGNFEN